VPSLRQWLTRKQKETRRGRAELLLADRAAVWNARRENRQLPSLLQWLQIRLLTPNKNWTLPQRQMMHQAGRYHLVRAALLALFLSLLGWGAREVNGRMETTALLHALASAETTAVPDLLAKLEPYQRWAEPRLQEMADNPGSDRERLHATLALHHPSSAQQYLLDQFLKAGLADFLGLRTALQRRREQLTEPLWTVLEDEKAASSQRFRAACALAVYDPDNTRWQQVGPAIFQQQLSANPLQLTLWLEALRPVPEAQHLRQVLVQVATRGNDARQQAQAAVLLLHLGQTESVWPLYKHSANPEARSQLLWQARLLNLDPRLLLQRLQEEKDVSARRALILSLGEFTVEQLPAEERQPLTQKLLQGYRDDPDPGMHGAIDWLLRHGKDGPAARPLDWEQAGPLQRIDSELRRHDPDGQRRWYVNGQGQTMVMVPGPVEALMGDPPGQIPKRIGRSFALASKAVTVAEFQRFLKDRPEIKMPAFSKQFSPEPACPMNTVSWFDAAQYCNWLSEKEGIPKQEWCYPEKIEKGMKLYPDYLKRKGYRLPTEAEWEFACRAGSLSSRYYGSSDELLPRYAWFMLNSDNRTWPVGQKRPNDLGLFDMHGNVWTWCQEPYGPYTAGIDGKPSEDKEDIRDVTDSISRSLRGGSFYIHPSDVRSALRSVIQPSDRNFNGGLRPARTYN
jgi:formylglycine-generating enzyme required for sulfatase activity